MTMADVPGKYGASNHQMVTFSAPGKALVVINWAMLATLHQRIHMVIKMASKPSVFLSLSTRN